MVTTIPPSHRAPALGASLRIGIPLTAALLVTAVLAVSLPARGEVIAAARVNGIDIPQERLERGFEEELRRRQMNLLQIRNPERMKQMKREVLDNLIEQELFWQAALANGITATPAEVDAAFDATKAAFRSPQAFEQRILVEGFTPQTYRELVNKQVHARKYAEGVAARAPAVTPEEIHQFYVDHPDRFRRPEQVSVRHIVINVPPGATDAVRAEKRALIDGVLGQLRAGADFDALARVHSEAPTRQWGGEMEPFARGQAARAVEDAAFSLPPGSLSEVIDTGEALQVLKVESRHDAIVVTEDQARERIRQHLQGLRASQAVADEAARLRAAGAVVTLPGL